MKLRVFDAHCDTAFELWKRNEPLAENSCCVDLQKCADFAAYAQVFAFCSYAGACPEIDAPQDCLTKPLARFRAELERNAERIALAASAREVERLNATGKSAALLSVEGAEVIGCDPGALEALREDGFVMTTLTWNADNALAGCHRSDRGLTAVGRDFVREAQHLGIAVDVSHLSEAAFWELMRVTRRPILASHSNARALCGHTRNLTNEQLRAVRDTDGVVGLNLYAPFLGENADFSTVLRHLEHLLCLCGEKHVVLGGDLDGGEPLPVGFENVRSYSALHAFLLARGYDERLLDRIFYTNLLEFFKK